MTIKHRQWKRYRVNTKYVVTHFVKYFLLFWQSRFFKWSWTTSVVMTWCNNWLLDLLSDGIVFLLSKFCFNVWIGYCDNSLYRPVWVTVEDSLRLEGIWGGHPVQPPTQSRVTLNLNFPVSLGGWHLKTSRVGDSQPAYMGLKSCSTVK